MTSDQHLPDKRRYRELTVGSLFSGIGGLDLGLERAGMAVIWQSEIDPYASRILTKHYPHVPNLGDITEIDWSTVERPDLVCGGFPCQPFSAAGRRRGIDDSRWLWPHFATCLRLVRPRWALLENVPGILTLGFGEVASDLAALGYDLEWECIPAAAVGAPHLRYRVFVVAHASSPGRQQEPRSAHGHEAAHERRTTPDDYLTPGDGEGDRARTVADTRGVRWIPGWYDTRQSPQSEPVDRCALADTDEVGRRGRSRVFGEGWRRQPENGGWWESEPDVGGTLDGFPAWLDRSGRLEQALQLVLADGNAVDIHPAEAVRTVRGDDGTPEVDERPVGGRRPVSAAAVLLTFLCQLEERCRQAGEPVAGPETPQASVRGVRLGEVAARPPLRRAAVQQRPGEPSDPLYALSQLLARSAGTAWAAYRRENASPVLNGWLPGWEDGVARVAHGVPARVDRLRCLGNAVVPQVAELVGRMILEAAS